MTKTKRTVRGAFTLVLALALALCAALPVWANDVKVVDEAGLFTEGERAEIQAALEEGIATLEIDMAVVTIDDALGYTSMEYADKYYEDNGYGLGDNRSGILLLINMEERELWISTAGSAMRAYMDPQLDAILDVVYSFVADGDFAGGALAFVSETVRIGTYVPPEGETAGPGEMRDPGQGQSSGSGNKGFDSETLLYVLLGSLGVAVLVVGIMLLVHNGSSPKAVSAHNYYQPGGVRRTHAADYFITSTVTKRPIPKDNNNGSSGGGSKMGGGGGGFHVSGGGMSHGGGGRKF